jgi:TolB protein
LAVCLGALVLAPSAQATFPGQNGKIAFLHKERGSLPAVYTMRPDGSHERRLARGWAPAFSPSGRKVVFTPYGISDHLYTIRANGTRLRRIPHTSRGFDGGFAPSGKKIVFPRVARHSDSDSDLYTIRLDGTHRKRITHLRGGDEGQFSPNGRWIVFDFVRSCDICLIRPNGTGLRSLTDHTADPVDDYSPDFSPNGRRVVFTRVTDTGVGPKRSGIYTIRKDGTHLRRVYEALATSGVVVGDAVYSPDGRKIAFSRRAGGLPDIYTIRPDGSHMRRLSHGPGGHEQLSWGVRPR